MKSLKSFVLLLGFLLKIESAMAAIPKYNVEIDSGRTLKERVETRAELLKKDLALAQNDKEKFRALERTLSEIAGLRANNLFQDAKSEAYMDLMVTVLESIPDEYSFRKSDCLKYENDFLNEFEPMALDAPEEPAVQPGWAVLQSLCR